MHSYNTVFSHSQYTVVVRSFVVVTPLNLAVGGWDYSDVVTMDAAHAKLCNAPSLYSVTIISPKMGLPQPGGVCPTSAKVPSVHFSLCIMTSDLQGALSPHPTNR